MEEMIKISETSLYNLLMERIKAYIVVKMMPNDVLYIRIIHENFEVGYFYENDFCKYIMLGGSLERMADFITKKYRSEIRHKYFY